MCERMKILIAEDDEISRLALKRTLEGSNYEVFEAVDGRLAEDIIYKENVRLVIADWLMPEVDGVQLCEKIRNTDKIGYVYFILLTEKNSNKDIIQGLEKGADDYITKPFDLDELLVRVRGGERILNLEQDLRVNNEKLHELNKKLEEMTLLDPLMEIGNRRGFHSVIERSHDRAIRYGHSYGLILCDIDHFKVYNDTYGHLAGDNILRVVADSIKKSSRLSDEIFRYGGEEFVIILPEQEESSTFAVAERITRDIESLRIENKNTERKILTVSCGVGHYKSSNKDDINWPTVLEMADKAMYKAKSKGRNQVCKESF